MNRPRRRPTGRLLVLALAACTACADEPAPPPASGDALYAVHARGLPWERRLVADNAPLSVSWLFDTPAADRGPMTWTASGGTQHQYSEGTLLLVGDGVAAIQGPTLDPEIHHVLALRLRTRDVDKVLVRWRGEGEAFHESRTYTATITETPEDDWQDLAIPVSSLRGTRHLLPPEPGDPPGRKRWSKARDAAEGVRELRIAFTGKGAVKAQLDELHVLSDFDRDELVDQRLGRAGIYCVGNVMRSGDSLAARFTPVPDERLRMWLAVAGASGPTTVRLRETGGLLEERSWTLAPDEEWRSVKVDLAPAGGRPVELELLAEGGGRRAVVMAGGVVRMAPAETARPSIVLYLVDTLRADRLGTYGYPRATDPVLRRIAAEGVVFERAFASSNWTRPATSSILTSLDGITHGNTSHLARVSPDVRTLAEQLADSGYLTTSFVTNFNASEWAGLEQGMDVWHDPPAYGAVHAADSLTSRLIGGPIREFLAEHADEQVFLYAHSGDPHVPYDPPSDLVAVLADGPEGPGFSEMEPEVRGNALRYDAEVLFNDGEIGLIDDVLEAEGRRDDTIFVFVSDHGEGFGEHGAFEHRNTLYQEELHVPLVFRWPAAIPPGQRRSEPVSQVDVAPTLLGLVGAPGADEWQGRDLSAELLAGPDAAIPDAPLFSHVLHSAPKDGLRDEVAVLWGDYKLIAGVTEDGEIVPRALHHLGDDPGETEDLRGRPEVADVEAAAVRWARERVALSRTASRPAEADAMDPQQRHWMEEMGYLGK